MKKAIVTGGSGYLGNILIKKLLNTQWKVINIDINESDLKNNNLKYCECDIRDFEKLKKCSEPVDAIFHCVAQVPLAKDKKKFWSVNSEGTENVCKVAKNLKIKKIVYISSSAIFGIPNNNPVTEETIPNPAEDYGKAKLNGEKICRKYASSELKVIIIRPRTILGHDRLGIMQILFEWIENNKVLPVLNKGKNIYQFVHVDDLVNACLLAENKINNNLEIFNIGTDRFSTMYDLLDSLVLKSNSKSKIKSLSLNFFEIAGKILYFLNLTPLGPYHHIMYGRSLWFDITKAKNQLGFIPKYSNNEMIFETYNHYIQSRKIISNKVENLSLHRSSIKKKLLILAPIFINIFGRKIKKSSAG